MPDDNSTPKFPMTIGLCQLVEKLQLQIPLPAIRSEIVAGARRTIAADGKTLEQYPKNYMPKGLIGNLRFALRYENSNKRNINDLRRTAGSLKY
jgi:hypothetical protein